MSVRPREHPRPVQTPPIINTAPVWALTYGSHTVTLTSSNPIQSEP